MSDAVFAMIVQHALMSIFSVTAQAAVSQRHGSVMAFITVTTGLMS